MKADKASATSRLIAAATVLCAREAQTADLVAPSATEWARDFLSTSTADRWLRSSAESGLSRAAWKLLERATHPGIARHWMTRKKWIELHARQAISGGVEQIVILGAGLDSLGVRLKLEQPSLRIVEIDHPATLKGKRAVLEARLGQAGPILVEADFGRETGEQRPVDAVDRDRPTLFLAEGLLMYLPEARVRSLLGGLATLMRAEARLIFSFMVERDNGLIGFEPRSALVSWWLARKDERFLWSLNPTKARAFARELGWEVTEHADAIALAGIAGGDRVIARGEEIIEAILIKS